MKRLATMAGTTALALGVLAGCGSDDGDDSSGADGAGTDSGGGDYCATIEDVRGEFESMQDTSTSIDALDKAGDRFGEIVDVAPSDIKGDWETLQSAFGDMASALEDAGLDTETPLTEAMKDDPKAAKQAQTEVLKALGGVQASQQAIQTQVKKECNIDMGAGAPE